MNYRLYTYIYIAIASVTWVMNSQAQKVPAGASAPPIPITSHDRVYHADQVSNTVSVYDTSSNTLLSVIPLAGRFTQFTARALRVISSSTVQPHQWVHDYL